MALGTAIGHSDRHYRSGRQILSQTLYHRARGHAGHARDRSRRAVVVLVIGTLLFGYMIAERGACL
jgi:hypothetical protein